MGGVVSLRVGGPNHRLINTDAAFGASSLSAAEYRRRLQYQTRAATWANKTKGEHADNAEKQKG